MTNQTNFPGKDLFEYTLKKVSVGAFDALLACGVRNLAGLMHLTPESLSQADISPQIKEELIKVQFQIRELSSVSNRQDNGIESYAINNQATSSKLQGEGKGKDQIFLASQSGTPIPHDLMERISTRARNVLIREHILSCEQLLELQEKDLFNFAGIGKKTVHDIKRLQEKIGQRHNKFCPKSTKLVQNSQSITDERSGLSKFAPYAPRCDERKTSDSPAWSVLSRTLPEVFQVNNLPWCNSSIEGDQLPIGSLGISSDDIEKLRKIVLFPEDPIEFLLSITTDYLFQTGIDNDTLSIILNHLAYLSGFSEHTHLSLSRASVSGIAIYSDIQISLFGSFRLSQEAYSNLLITEERDSVLTWGDLANISERSVIKRLGFTAQGISAICYLWRLKDQAFEIQNTILKGLPITAYCSFEQLTDAFTQAVVNKTQESKKARESSVLKGRLGLLDGRKWTLEELGLRENLTRERIRQIEAKLLPILKKPRILEQLSLLWLTIDEILISSGGVCCATEIAGLLRNHWEWATLPSEEGLASVISLSANYELIWESPIRIIMPNHKCINCTEIRTVLIRAVESQANGMLPFEDANAIMLDFCKEQHCENLHQILKFSHGYLHFLADAMEEIITDEDTLYTQFAWAQKYGKRKSLLVETIVRNAGRPMHFTEVHAEINKNRPLHGQIPERNIYAYIERSPDLLLWDRGTFIHRDFVTIPGELMARIEDEIILRLNGNIPYVSVAGIFELFEKELLGHHIISGSALYSCLRESNNKGLICPEYPYILKNTKDAQRLPVPLVLEAFVLEQERTVTYEEIRHYAVGTLCLNEALFVASHFQNIPNLLRIDRGEYIHIDQLAIEESKLVPIIDHLITLLDSSNHVSAIKLYDDKKITCKLLGISTPMLLFSLIEFFYSDRFHLSRYPKICLTRHTSSESRAVGVATEVIRYIRGKGIPCSFDELYQHFVEELGYNQISVHNVLYTYKDILRYSEGVIVHHESLAWTEKKQAGLEKLATSHLYAREITGKPFGLVSYLYEYMYDQLPKLPDQIVWTATLVGELLSREGKFAIIGTARNVFVSTPNSHNIETLGDLLYFVLRTEYDGAANIDHFISDMRDVGILKKSLTPMMLGEDSRVIIDGNVVRLAELNDRAEGT